MDETLERAKLNNEIAVTMEQIMEAIGGGTLMIPDEISRGMMETARPSLDLGGLRALRDDLQRLAAEHELTT